MKKELKIYYSGKLNEELDEDLEDLLGKYGYKRWASGYNLEENIRDLAFEIPKDKKLSKKKLQAILSVNKRFTKRMKNNTA